MASQFDLIMKTLNRQQRDLMDIQDIVAHNRKLLGQVIHMMGPHLDQDSLQLGLDQPIYAETGVDPSEGLRAELPDIRIDEPTGTPMSVAGEGVTEDESPRTRLVYKTNQGGEAFVEWNDLTPDMQIMVEIARVMPGEWQLYEDPAGSMRIMVDPQAEQEFRRRKLGNRTGK